MVQAITLRQLNNIDNQYKEQKDTTANKNGIKIQCAIQAYESKQNTH